MPAWRAQGEDEVCISVPGRNRSVWQDAWHEGALSPVERESL